MTNTSTHPYLKYTYNIKTTHKKLKPYLVTSYNIRPGNVQALWPKNKNLKQASYTTHLKVIQVV